MRLLFTSRVTSRELLVGALKGQRQLISWLAGRARGSIEKPIIPIDGLEWKLPERKNYFYNYRVTNNEYILS